MQVEAEKLSKMPVIIINVLTAMNILLLSRKQMWCPKEKKIIFAYYLRIIFFFRYCMVNMKMVKDAFNFILVEAR